MAILRQLLVHAATKLTSDPRIRAKAADVLEHEVKPRAAVAWSHTRPKLEAARDELRDIAEGIDPRENPRAFVVKVKERFLERGRSRWLAPAGREDGRVVRPGRRTGELRMITSRVPSQIRTIAGRSRRAGSMHRRYPDSA